MACTAEGRAGRSGGLRTEHAHCYYLNFTSHDQGLTGPSGMRAAPHQNADAAGTCPRLLCIVVDHGMQGPTAQPWSCQAMLQVSHEAAIGFDRPLEVSGQTSVGILMLRGPAPYLSAMQYIMYS